MISVSEDLHTALIVLNTISSLALLWSVVCTTNSMHRGTKLVIRIAFILMGTGAFAALLTPFFLPRAPSYAEIFLMFGFALFAYSDRRRRNVQIVRNLL